MQLHGRIIVLSEYCLLSNSVYWASWGKTHCGQATLQATFLNYFSWIKIVIFFIGICFQVSNQEAISHDLNRWRPCLLMNVCITWHRRINNKTHATNMRMQQSIYCMRIWHRCLTFLSKSKGLDTCYIQMAFYWQWITFSYAFINDHPLSLMKSKTISLVHQTHRILSISCKLDGLIVTVYSRWSCNGRWKLGSCFQCFIISMRCLPLAVSVVNF